MRFYVLLNKEAGRTLLLLPFDFNLVTKQAENHEVKKYSISISHWTPNHLRDIW